MRGLRGGCGDCPDDDVDPVDTVNHGVVYDDLADDDDRYVRIPSWCPDVLCLCDRVLVVTVQ